MAEKLHAGTGFSDFQQAETRMLAAGSGGCAAYAALSIPGLLQTEEYARGIWDENILPISESVAQGRWKERLVRQEAFFREESPPRGVFLIAHMAITHVDRLIEPSDAIEQLEQVRRRAELPHIDVRVFEPDRRLPHVVYTLRVDGRSLGWWAEEPQIGGFTITETGQAAMCEAVFELANDLSLPTDESIELIESQIAVLTRQL